MLLLLQDGSIVSTDQSISDMVSLRRIDSCFGNLYANIRKDFETSERRNWQPFMRPSLYIRQMINDDDSTERRQDIMKQDSNQECDPQQDMCTAV